MLFLSYRGLGLVEIGLVESAYQFAMLVFGVPAGAIADLIGRKVCLVLSVVAKIIGYYADTVVARYRRASRPASC